MVAPRKVARRQSFMPTSDISAMMPPSPWLSARMTKKQYFSEMVTSSVQKISDRTPNAVSAGELAPTEPMTVCMV